MNSRTRQQIARVLSVTGTAIAASRGEVRENGAGMKIAQIPAP